jgi:type I restriction enzyme S subunit
MRPVQAGTVLFSFKLSIGKLGIAAATLFTNEAIASLPILDRTLLCEDYLFHALQQISGRLVGDRAAMGITLNKASLAQIEIPLPPLEEQRRIAAILDKAGSLKAHDRLREKSLSSFEDSLFRHFFGGIAEQANQWHWQKFGDLCSRLTVGVVVKPASYYCENGVPALRSLNVKAGAISEENLVFISDLDNNGALAKSRLATGDLVFVRSGRPGTCAVIPPGLDGCNAIDLLLATVDQSIILPEFVSSYFNSQGGRASILSESRGQIQQHFNAGSLVKASIPVPPVTLQQEFCAVLNQKRLQAKRCDSSLAALVRLSSALSSEFFGGS